MGDFFFLLNSQNYKPQPERKPLLVDNMIIICDLTSSTWGTAYTFLIIFVKAVYTNVEHDQQE